MSHFPSYLVAIALTLLVTGCNKQPVAGTPDASDLVKPTSKVLKIAVMRDGSITADGTTTTIDALASKLTDLATKKGVVWYYREAAEGEPHPNATKVIEAIIEHRLAISLSSKPDFSDVIGADGKSYPRQ